MAPLEGRTLTIHRTYSELVKYSDPPVAGVWISCGDRWTRRPISRVLSRLRTDAAIIPLDRPLLDGSRDLPGRLGPTTALPAQGGRNVPIRSCSWRGLPCRPCHQVRGGLLPHPFTLTSAAAEAVCSLWRYPWGRPRRALPAAMSSWSPDFPRPPEGSRDRPAVWSARSVRPKPPQVKRREQPAPSQFVPMGAASCAASSPRPVPAPVSGDIAAPPRSARSPPR